MVDAATQNPAAPELPPLSSVGRYLMLITSFFGWFFAGTQMTITAVAMRSAAKDLLGQQGTDEGLVGLWFSRYTVAFLIGAAVGGLFFGWLGDRFGRTKAMAWSILCYSVFAGISYYAQSPEELLALRFLACMGVGGMWPNGVALVSEAWSNLSRPLVAGIIGTAANVGIFCMAQITKFKSVTPDDWRWVMLVVASPVILGVFAWIAVPESPRWLASRHPSGKSKGAGSLPRKQKSPVKEIFQPPYRQLVIIGIILGAVPLIGGWGSANWLVPWADQVGEQMSPPDPSIKSNVVIARSLTGMVGSFLGGILASMFGRRLTYVLISVAALGISQYIFWFLEPTDGATFMIAVAALGLFSGIYFGWLPLCLPEMFPTRVRATGSGVSFNFGRILTAATVLISGMLLHEVFQGDYAAIGRVTSFIYLIGIIAILFAPDTSKTGLKD